MNTPIDIYCERLQHGLWEEPLNLISNLAFFIAGIAAFMLGKKRGVMSPCLLWLCVMILAIGTGSALFHSFANTWSKFADVIPILIFQISFLWVYARYVIKWNKTRTAMLVGSFFIVSFLSGLLPYDWLNGSLSYSPALIFVLGLGLYHMRTGKNERYSLLAAGIIFVVSLTFRSLDMAVCSQLPIGLHYMWHCLNAAVLYLSVRSIIVNKI